jgi:hypothetical protein
MQENMVQNATTDTGSAVEQDNSQVQASGVKTFTQDEVNKIIAARLAKVENKYADIDVEEYKQFKTARQKQEEDALIKRQEFDKVLTQTKDHYSSQMSRLKQELETIKVDGAILSAASNLKVVAPDHVAKLLKGNVRLSEDGQVEVLDDKGQVRYNPESATPLTVDDLVKEFVKTNPFYQSPGPAGSGSRSNMNAERSGSVDITKLDMRNAQDRAVYKQHMSKK